MIEEEALNFDLYCRVKVTSMRAHTRTHRKHVSVEQKDPRLNSAIWFHRPRGARLKFPAYIKSISKDLQKNSWAPRLKLSFCQKHLPDLHISPNFTATHTHTNKTLYGAKRSSIKFHHFVSPPQGAPLKFPAYIKSITKDLQKSPGHCDFSCLSVENICYQTFTHLI